MLFGKPRSEVIKRPGAFSKKAKEAGESTDAYAAKVTKKGSKASARTKRQAGLAKAFATMRSKKKSKGGGKKIGAQNAQPAPSTRFLKNQYRQGQM